MNGHFAHTTAPLMRPGNEAEACMDDDDADSRANRWRTEDHNNTSFLASSRCSIWHGELDNPHIGFIVKPIEVSMMRQQGKIDGERKTTTTPATASS
jgi:hypothetical protein